ncbi:MAG: ABC transporter ATP-binding protein [Euryarchaeota archaeon]|nr:ABC transporter ATP-binding protein [Euryarchaeota archaeon]
MAIIDAKGVVKTYDTGKVKVEALKGVDLSVEKGEMVAIMGPSGCGKTTMLNCLSGLDDLTAGKVLLEGSDIHAMKDDARTTFRARKMGFIFQNFNLLPVLTAAENVELPLLLVGVSTKAAREKAQGALALVGMEDRKDHKPAELSGGQQQRVTIARSLVNEPAIVWADEPTGNLDTDKSAEVIGLMKQLNREKGLTFVIVTHDPGVGRKCGRVIEMRNGLISSETRC